MSEGMEGKREGEGGGEEVKSEGVRETALETGTEEMENKVSVKGGSGFSYTT